MTHPKPVQYKDTCPHCGGEDFKMIGDPEYNDLYLCGKCGKEFSSFNTERLGVSPHPKHGREVRNSPQDQSHAELPLDIHRVGCLALNYAYNLGVDKTGMDLGWMEEVEEEIQELITKAINEARLRDLERIEKEMGINGGGIIELQGSLKKGLVKLEDYMKAVYALQAIRSEIGEGG